MIGKLEALNFDEYLGLSEKQARRAAIACNDAFILAMGKAVSRGREKAIPGTYIDLSPAIGARRIFPEAARSFCGSPAAMCMENGGAPSGAETMK